MGRDIIGRLATELDDVAPFVSEAIWWSRRREDTAHRIVDLSIRRGDRVVDVGAERGHFTARMLRLVGSSGAVIAVEANPEHLPRLNRMRTFHRNLHVCGAAASDLAGHSYLSIPDEHGGGLGTMRSSSAVVDGSHVVEISCIRLSDVIADRAVQFIKCDVEGHEGQALAGAEQILVRDHPTLLVEIEQRHRDEPPQTTIDYLLDLGYHGWMVTANGVRPVSEFQVERDQLPFVDLADDHGSMPSQYVNDFVFAKPGSFRLYESVLPARAAKASAMVS